MSHQADNETTFDEQTEKRICFRSTIDGSQIELTFTDLENYPDSFFAQRAKRYKGDLPIGIPLPKGVLEAVQQFFASGSWPNPYLYKNREKVRIPDINLNFEQVCDILGLPDDIEMSESESDDINECEIPGFPDAEFDDDFSVYNGEPEPDDYDDELYDYDPVEYDPVDDDPWE